MHFGSRRPGGLGQADICRAELVDGRYEPAECLPEPVNSPVFEGDALIAPDESHIYGDSFWVDAGIIQKLRPHARW